MNILVSNISTLPAEKYFIPKEYEIKVTGCDVSKISAIHTNESVVKCFAEMKEIKRSGGINRIIMMVSKKVKDPVSYCNDLSAKDYFKKIVEEIMPIPEYVEIDIEDENGNPLPTSHILDEICSNIQRDDKVYIDSAGGQRTISNLVQLLAKILRYIGVETPCTLYSDIQNAPFIYNTSEFTNMTELAEALNEFMTSGKADQLKGCFKNPTKEVSVLLDAMRDFSDKIRLGNVDDLDDTIVKLRESIVSCKNVPVRDNVEMVVLKRFLPVIELKLLGESGKMDYAKIVQWCLDNALIQQALTVFVEKIPTFIFDQEIICFKGLVSKEMAEYQKIRASNPSKPAAWEADALYTKLLDLSNVVAFEEFKGCILKGRPSNNKDVKNAVDILRKIKKEFPKPIFIKNKTLLEKEIESFINNGTIVNYSGLINSLTSNLHPLTMKLLGINDEFTNDVMKKMYAINSIRTGKCYYGSFTWNVKNEILAEMLYGYMYVKLMRNQINHASSEENFSNDSKTVLMGQGYDFSTFNIAVVRKNIQKALDAIRLAVAADAENKISELLEKAIPTTTNESKMNENDVENDVTPYTPPKKIETVHPTLQAPVVLGKIDLDSIKDGKRKKR